jgi:Ca-activated chloride channel family protein
VAPPNGLSDVVPVRVVFQVMLLPCALLAHAQEPPRFSSSTDLVVLHVSVTDKKGRVVDGLTRQSFSVLENRQPQPIAFFGSDELPVTAGLILDNSISMFGVLDRLVAAASAFAEASDPRDEIFALAFNERVRAALPPGMPFTNDAVVLRDALSSVASPRGRTALFDAIRSALDYAARGHHTRKALVVISDGGDNASTVTFADALALTQASNAVIYAVVLTDPASRDAKPEVMKRLAAGTGGQVFTPRSVRDLSDVLRRIATTIRQTYTVGYVPTAPLDGTFRRLQVVVKAPDGRTLVVRTREGYLAAHARGGKS